MRTALVDTRLTQHAREIGVVPIPLTADDWNVVMPETPFKPFGWEPPEFKPVSGLFAFRFSPEIIAQQSAHLDEPLFSAYIDAIEILANMHVTHREMPMDQRVRMAESTLYNMAPGSMKLVTEVQMAALDARQETP